MSGSLSVTLLNIKIDKELILGIFCTNNSWIFDSIVHCCLLLFYKSLFIKFVSQGINNILMSLN